MAAHLTPIDARPATMGRSTTFTGPITSSRSSSARRARRRGRRGHPVRPRAATRSRLLAAGGCIAAVDAVLDGTVDNIYALVRPPGHHAEAARGRGYCIFANAAIAARHAQRARGLERIAIVDWDVHHGNGSERRVLRRPVRAHDLAAPGGALPRRPGTRHRRRGGRRRRLQPQHPAARGHRPRRLRACVRAGRAAGAGRVQARPDPRRVRPGRQLVGSRRPPEPHARVLPPSDPALDGGRRSPVRRQACAAARGRLLDDRGALLRARGAGGSSRARTSACSTPRPPTAAPASARCTSTSATRSRLPPRTSKPR